MDILLRELRDGPGGIAMSSDTELATKELSIGCAPDQRLQLLGRGVGAQHAVIRGTSNRLSLVCGKGLSVTLNGRAARSARLDIGDCLELGGHRLTVVQAPAGFDLAIELLANPQIDARDFEAAFRTDLQQTWLSGRAWAWLLMGLVALFGFGIPWLAVRGLRGGASGAALLPAQIHASSAWSTGPLATGHQQLMGDRCATCHQSPAAAVPDAACQACHKNIGAHVNDKTLAQTTLGPAQPCIACHREHEEPTGNLVDRTDDGCVACHARAPEKFGTLPVLAVSGFGAGRHPAFAAAAQLLKIVKDQSALKFSHAQHLDGTKSRRGASGTLGCSDCHKLSPGGEHFEPPTMADNCAGCHELAFDPEAPDRQLPHGRPRDVVRALQDYFARKLTEPKSAQAPVRVRQRLPGHDEPEVAPCTGSVYTCAMKLAADETKLEFERRGCITCHKVTDTGSASLTERFTVDPVSLVRAYFPAARFPHQNHLIQSGVTGDAACLSCHPANNPQAQQPLLPPMGTCEGCHSDTVVRDRSRLQCGSCHTYHPRS